MQHIGPFGPIQALALAALGGATMKELEGMARALGKAEEVTGGCWDAVEAACHYIAEARAWLEKRTPARPGRPGDECGIQYADMKLAVLADDVLVGPSF